MKVWNPKTENKWKVKYKFFVLLKSIQNTKMSLSWKPNKPKDSSVVRVSKLNPLKMNKTTILNSLSWHVMLWHVILLKRFENIYFRILWKLVPENKCIFKNTERLRKYESSKFENTVRRQKYDISKSENTERSQK